MDAKTKPPPKPSELVRELVEILYGIPPFWEMGRRLDEAAKPKVRED